VFPCREKVPTRRTAAGAGGVERRNHLRRYLLIVGVLAMLLSVPQAALAQGAGTYLATFLEVDGGTRQIGMGGAFTGMGDDAMTIYYNPAGLRFLEGSEVHFSGSTWPAGVSYQHLAYGFRHSVVPGYFGISWTIMQMGPFTEKTEYFDPDSEFDIGTLDNVDAGDMAFGGSYAWEFFDGFSVGGTFKWYHLAIADAFCEGVCGDLGVLWDTRLRNLRVGAAVQNVGPTNRFSGTGEGDGFGGEFPMPRVVRAGASIRVYDVVTHRLSVAADYKRPRSGDNQFHMGGEYTFNRGKIFAYGRAGYRMGYDEEGLTLGLGVRFPSSQEADARFDYAFVNMENLEDVHRFSVAFFF
jgi:hypothetical protein